MIGVSNIGHAELYQWVDEDGVAHYSNTFVADEDGDVDEGFRVLSEKEASPDTIPDLNTEKDDAPETKAVAKEEKQTAQAEQIEKNIADREEALRDRLNLEIDHYNREIKNNEEKLELTKIELKEAEDRYYEIKRESYSDTIAYRKKLQKATSRKMRYENRIKTLERSIQDYKDLIKVNKEKLSKLSD